MNKSKSVPMMISLPKEVRDNLRIMAAEQNMKNPDQVTSAATIAKNFILEGIDRDEHMKMALNTDDAIDSALKNNNREEDTM
jgi:hypothetical protein